MSSKVAARECHPGREAGSARTICASVLILTVPRPNGRSTRQTSISTGVPGSIRWGQRKSTPLELILVVRSGSPMFSLWPATRFTCNGRLSFARAYERRSSGGRTEWVGTRAMPLGLARVVHDGGSTTEVAERADNSVTAALPRLGLD